MKLNDALTRLPGRQARPSNFAWNMIKTLTQTAAMWAFFLFAVPRAIVAIEQRTRLRKFRFASSASRAVGGAMFVAGGALAEWSAETMVRYGEGTPLPLDSPRRLVVAGPYRHVRNPMAIGSLFLGFAVGVHHGSPLVVAFALAGVLAWDRLARPWEEHDLDQRFGPSFRRYRAAVKCWIPRLEPYRGGDPEAAVP